MQVSEVEDAGIVYHIYSDKIGLYWGGWVRDETKNETGLAIGTREEKDDCLQVHRSDRVINVVVGYIINTVLFQLNLCIN